MKKASAIDGVLLSIISPLAAKAAKLTSGLSSVQWCRLLPQLHTWKCISFDECVNSLLHKVYKEECVAKCPRFVKEIANSSYCEVCGEGCEKSK